MADKYQHRRQSSFGYKTETSYGTPIATDASDTGWVWLLCEPPDITFNREIENRELLEGQSMVEGAPTIGSKHGGTFTVRGDIRSQPSAFDATSDALNGNPETDMLRDFFGSEIVGAYDAADIVNDAAQCDANTWVTDAGTYGPGEMFASGASATVASAFAVVVSQSVQTLTLLQDTVAEPVDNDATFGFLNIYSSTVQPVYKTFRHTGADAEFDLNLVGCTPVSCTITMNARKVPTYEMTYKFTSWTHVPSGSYGGLKDPADFLAVPPFLGNNNGRLVINGVTDADGSIVSGTCNVSDVALNITIEDTELDCHSSPEGVTGVVVGNRRCRLSFNMPIEDTDIASNEVIWDTRLTAGTSFSFTAEVGTTPGALFGCTIPALRVNAQPQRVVVNDNLVGYSIECAPAPYSGDTATGAGDSAVRIHLG